MAKATQTTDAPMWGANSTEATDTQRAKAEKLNIGLDAYRILRALVTANGKAKTMDTPSLKAATGIDRYLYWIVKGTFQQGQRWPLVQLGWVECDDTTTPQSFEATTEGCRVMTKGLTEDEQASILARFKAARSKSTKGKPAPTKPVKGKAVVKAGK